MFRNDAIGRGIVEHAEDAKCTHKSREYTRFNSVNIVDCQWFENELQKLVSACIASARAIGSRVIHVYSTADMTSLQFYANFRTRYFEYSTSFSTLSLFYQLYRFSDTCIMHAQAL